MNRFTRFIVKKYLKSFARYDRPLRTNFVGKRLAVRQYQWLHYTPTS